MTHKDPRDRFFYRLYKFIQILCLMGLSAMVAVLVLKYNSVEGPNTFDGLKKAVEQDIERAVDRGHQRIDDIRQKIKNYL